MREKAKRSGRSGRIGEKKEGEGEEIREFGTNCTDPPPLPLSTHPHPLITGTPSRVPIAEMTVV